MWATGCFPSRTSADLLDFQCMTLRNVGLSLARRGRLAFAGMFVAVA